MKRIFFAVLILVLVFIISGYLYLKNTAPTYSGVLEINELKDKVIVKYDEYGIPHIYANNEIDAYIALGYVHAQERLFQMEMIRRVSSGTLSEILGSEFLAVDKLFRTLGIKQKSEQFAKQFHSSNYKPHKQAAESYFKGVNSFIENGTTPIEFTIIGIPKRKFTIEDAYITAGYMSFGFAEGFRIDPILSQLVSQYGTTYLEDLALKSPKESVKIPSFLKINSSQLTSLGPIVEKIPIPLLVGSNSWIIGSDRSKSGKPIFENDTHIGYSQPSVWFEAHLEYPGMSHYGHYLAGVPFSLLGHNNFAAIGITMFENDDVDFYVEKENKHYPDQVWSKNQWKELEIREEIIKIKDEKSDTLKIRISPHGPIVNDIFFKDHKNKSPISVSWGYLHFTSDLMETIYHLNHISSMDDARKGASMIEAPGLNIMYADIDHNIAWWASAKLPIRPIGVNSKLILDGSSGEDDILGYYTFEDNPKSENPPWGYVYSANNQPDTIDGLLYPGYYFPDHRADRIVTLIGDKKNWTAEDSKKMSTDVISNEQRKIALLISGLIKNSTHLLAPRIATLLKNWDGGHQIDQVEPSIHYTFLSWLIYYTMNDELGYKNLKTIHKTSLFKTSYWSLFENKNAVWWDNVHTPKKETRADIIKKTLVSTVGTLEKNFSTSDPKKWKWGEIHTITHGHPLGKVDMLKNYFNVGPYPIKGGNEVINNQMFAYDTTGVFPVIAGPAVRTVIDLANMKGAESINPTGQSGNFLSVHYTNQAKMFIEGDFRPQLMDSLAIAKATKSLLTLSPLNESK